jgi:hypothetical protein
MAITVPPTDYAAGPPAIDRSSIPAAEQPALLHLLDLLASLGRYEQQFSLAVLLFDEAHEENTRLVRAVEVGQLSFGGLDQLTNTLSGWQMMAARDGALAIYHFGQTLPAVKAAFGQCASLRPVVDFIALRLAANVFEATFPSYEAIRHAVGHVADFAVTPKKKAEHSIKGPWKGEFGGVGLELKDFGLLHRFSDNLYDRSYCITIEGKVHSYEVSVATLAKLRTIRASVYAAFDKATTVNPLA